MRIPNSPEVAFALCTPLGTPLCRPTGPAIGAHARILEGGEAPPRQLLARKYPVSHGVLVPLVHRLRGNKTMHVEFRPVVDARRGRC